MLAPSEEQDKARQGKAKHKTKHKKATPRAAIRPPSATHTRPRSALQARRARALPPAPHRAPRAHNPTRPTTTATLPRIYLGPLTTVDHSAPDGTVPPSSILGRLPTLELESPILPMSRCHAAA